MVVVLYVMSTLIIFCLSSSLLFLLFGDFRTNSEHINTVNDHTVFVGESMKRRTLIIVAGLVIFVAVAGVVMSVILTTPQQRHIWNSDIYLTELDTNTTINASVDDEINLTLQDFGDGGYEWVITQIDNHFVSLEDQYTWGSSGLLGDFGKTTCIFSAENLGSTTIQLECRRPWATDDICQTFMVTLNIS